MVTRSFLSLIVLLSSSAALCAQPGRLRAHADLRSKDHDAVVAAARRFERRAATLGETDLVALERAAGALDARVAAAPELRSTFLKVARLHPSAQARAKAKTLAAGLETDTRLVLLRRTVKAKQAAGAGGVEIWSAVARRAVELNRGRKGLTRAQRFDEVMADVGRVLNGRSSTKHLSKYQRTLGRLPGSDKHLPVMIRALDARSADVAWAGGKLDREQSDFRAELQDGSLGQVYHTNFFVLLGYSVGAKDPRLPHWVNLKHETRDQGERSEEDWTASAVGIEVGRRLRKLRDGEGDLRAIPAIVGAAFSARPGDYARPWGPKGPDYTQLVASVDEESRARIKSPRGSSVFGRVASKIQRGLVGAFRNVESPAD